MMEASENNQVINQVFSSEAVSIGVYSLLLLFREKCERPPADILLEKMRERFGNVHVVIDSTISSFALTDHCVTYKGDVTAPSQLMICECNKIKEPLGDDCVRANFWDCPSGIELLDSCPWQVLIGDFMAGGLPTLERANILSDWLEIALELFPACVAVFPRGSGKLMTTEKIRENPYSGPLRFIRYGVNARFFTIENSEDMVVDTLGLHALGLPDVQYHFRDLDPNEVVTHAYDTAIYQFENDAPVESGHTIRGIDPESKWKCQYEDSLFEPSRIVLDVAAGEFAAGNRK